MGRNRVIDRDGVLDAAQRVVSRDGAVGLTLEAVAAEAGISKASVLYDYRNKQALIRAVIERRVALEEAHARDTIDRLAGEPDAAIRGRIAAAFRTRPDEDRAVALSLCAALAQDAELRRPIQDAVRRVMDEIEATSAAPRGARLAFLAAEGMKLLEWFGLREWSAAERDELGRDMRWLAGQTPPPTPPPGGDP